MKTEWELLDRPDPAQHYTIHKLSLLFQFLVFIAHPNCHNSFNKFLAEIKGVTLRSMLSSCYVISPVVTVLC